MARVIADFTNAREIEFDRTPLPPGIYTAVIDASYAEKLQTRRDGVLAFTLGFVITEPEQYAGRLAFANYPLAGEYAGITKRLLRTLGFDVDAQGNLYEFDTNALGGHEVVIRVREGVNNVTGEKTANVTVVRCV